MLKVAVVAAGCMTAAALLSCRSDHEFDSPYLPGNPGYAGDDWTRDRDGNGIADSLDKYTPGCRLPPSQCLENAQIISKIPLLENSMQARNLVLWVGDSAQPPILEWKPAEGALRGYLLGTSDSTKVRVIGGMVAPVSEGSAQITVTVPGMETLNTSFIAKVASAGKRVESVAVPDIVLQSGRDTIPPVAWLPIDAQYRDYSLASDKPGVALVVGTGIRGVFPGKASLTLVTMDGARKTAFSVTVKDAPPVIPAVNLVAEPMFLVKDAPAEAPILTWTPANASDQRYRLVTVEAPKVVEISADSQKVVPKATGSAQVLVMSQDGLLAKEILVTVSAHSVPVTGVTAGELSLVLGSDPVPPRLIWMPEDATNRRYSLATSDVNVALPSSGKIEPMGMGTADFTVTTDDGGFQSGFRVTVGRPDTAVHVDSVTVDPLSMAVGEERRIAPTWYPTDAGNRTFTLASGDSAVVQANGESLKALKAGTATVRLTAADGDRKADFKVTVFVPNIPVQMVTVDSMSIYVGKEAFPVITWTPSNAIDLGYTLTSGDTNIAEIIAFSGLQRVLGKAVGITKVTLKASGNVSTDFSVLVNAEPVKLNFITAANFTMNVGDPPKDPVINFNPANATDKGYSLGSPTGTTVITVDHNKVVAVGPGKAPLTITPNDTPAAAIACTVTVVARVSSVSAKDDTLRIGDSEKDVTSRLTWVPANATNKDFSLKSNDTNLVKISTSGKAYKGIGTIGGKTTVIVKALDGSGKADTFAVHVHLPVTQVIGKDFGMKAGDTTTYPTNTLISFLPAGATNKNWYLSYTNPAAVPAPASIVSIINGWQLKAGAAGTAKITVTSVDNPVLKDTFTVTVVQPVTGISASNMTIKVGEAESAPTVTVLPAAATDKGYSLTSGNTAIATVVGGTKVKAVAAGSATFTIRSTYDSTKTGTFTVTVTVPVQSVSVADIVITKDGGDKDPVITWNPSHATNKTYTLSGGNSSIATVSANRIHPVGGGATKMVVTSTDGGKVDTFSVTVHIPVTGIQGNSFSMRVGDDNVIPDVAVSPSDASNQGWTLVSEDPNIASIVGGKEIRAMFRGVATIRVISLDNESIVNSFTVDVRSGFGF